MDQAESEDQDLRGQKRERSLNANLCRADTVSIASSPQIHVKDPAEHATDAPNTAAQPVSKRRHRGAV